MKTNIVERELTKRGVTAVTMQNRYFLIVTILAISLSATLFAAEAWSAPASGEFPTGWQQMPGSTKSDGLTAVPFDGKVYVFFRTEKGVLLQVFDPATSQWLFRDSAMVPSLRWLPGYPSEPNSPLYPVTNITVVTTDTRLYLLTFSSKGLFSTSKQAGSDPLNGWDDRWEQRSASLLPQRLGNVTLPLQEPLEVHALKVAGNIYLTLTDGRWAAFDANNRYNPSSPSQTALSWQTMNLRLRDSIGGTSNVIGLIQGNGNRPAYIVSLGNFGYNFPIYHGVSSSPNVLGSACAVDARSSTSGSSVTGFEDSAGFFLFYRDYTKIVATMRGNDTDGLQGCSTWTGAASLFFNGLTPAVIPLPKAGTAMLFSLHVPSGMIYFHEFDAALDIVPEISTRSSSDGPYAVAILARGRFNVRGSRAGIPGLGGECAPELAVAIHGWTNANNDGQDKFQKAYRGLRALKYPYPIAGFSWPSDTNDSLLGIDDVFGFDEGKDMADRSALGFAIAVQKIKQACPQINIRLISHSLGGRVLLRVLQALNTDTALAPWRNAGYKIESIHLMGAAVDNEVPQTNNGNWGGPGIQRQVVRAFNYFSEEDNVLRRWFSGAEADNALGETGIEERQYAPSNYTDRDLTDEIGTDHYGYWSYINDDGTVGDVWTIGNVFKDFGPGYEQAILITSTYQSILHRLPTGEEYGRAQAYLRAGGTQQGLEPVVIVSAYQSILGRLATDEEYSSAQAYLRAGGTQQGLIDRVIVLLVPVFFDL